MKKTSTPALAEIMSASMQTTKCIWPKLLLVTLISCFITAVGYAHSDSEPLWERDAKELAELDARIEYHRNELLKSLDIAFRQGFGEDALRRPYNFTSNLGEVEIPRSVLNRVITSSMELEIASVEKYLFCNSCEHSLANDLKDHPEKSKAMAAIRWLWPKIKSNFTFLFKDIPVGLWKRVIYSSAYSREIGGDIRYQSKAYGTASMVAGATAFAVAYGVTETAEAIYLVGLHFLCQANYFWSIAFGTAIATLSRDIKTLLSFGKDNKPWWKRIGQAFTNYRSYKELTRIESRAVFQTIVGEANHPLYQELKRRAAYTSILQPVLKDIAPIRSVAADPLLWAELVNPNTSKPSSNSNSESLEQQKLLQQEIDRIFLPKNNSFEGLHLWHDLASSMRTILRTFRIDLQTQHHIHRNRDVNLSTLGQLDANLRSLDLFMFSLLKDRRTSNTTVDVTTDSKWLRNTVAEILSIAIETLDANFDKKVVDIRLTSLNSILDTSIKRGSPITLHPDGMDRLDIALKERVSVPLCQTVFGEN